MRKYIANCITLLRVVFSFLLLFCKFLSVWFFVVYATTALTDVFDGFVARKTKTETEFGSRLDTFADFVFVLVCFIKIVLALTICNYFYVWVGIIFTIKIFNIMLGFVKYKKFIPIHSSFNKLTGFIIFLFPFALCLVNNVDCLLVFVCAFATLSAIDETYRINILAKLN